MSWRVGSQTLTAYLASRQVQDDPPQADACLKAHLKSALLTRSSSIKTPDQIPHRQHFFVYESKYLAPTFMIRGLKEGI